MNGVQACDCVNRFNSQLLFVLAGSVSLQVWLLALTLLFALFLGIDFTWLFIFVVVLLGCPPREHLPFHRDVHATLLGHKEIFHLPGHAAVAQHEDDPVGAHDKPGGAQITVEHVV